MDHETLHQEIAQACPDEGPENVRRRNRLRLADEVARLEREAEQGLCRPRQILLVGGGGYVGTVMAREMLRRGYQVRILDSFLYGHTLAVEGLFDTPNYSLVRGDMRNDEDLSHALDGVTDVVLLASLVGDPISKKYPDLTRSVNVDGSKNLFDTLATQPVHKFVFLSTCSNYGLRNTDEPATETDALNPKSIYAETKVAFEEHVLGDCNGRDHASTVLRISTAYGLSSRMRFDLTVSEFARELAIGNELLVYDKDTWRPYCHLRDMADAVMRVLEAPADMVNGEVFNVGHSDENFTKAMIVEEVLNHLPDARSRVAYHEGGVDPRNYRVNFDKIRKVLDFVPQQSVRTYIPQLIAAIEAGLFSGVDEMRNFYGNYEISDI